MQWRWVFLFVWLRVLVAEQRSITGNMGFVFINPNTSAHTPCASYQ